MMLEWLTADTMSPLTVILAAFIAAAVRDGVRWLWRRRGDG